MIDASCLVSFILFFVSDLLEVTLIVKGVRNFNNVDFSKDTYYTSCLLSQDLTEDPGWLEYETCIVPEFVKNEWEFRRSISGLNMAVSLTSAAAWLALALPLCQVAWILSRAGRRRIALHGVICLLALSGSFAELIARLLLLGASNVTEWFSDSWNLESWNVNGASDFIGLRVLEMIYMSFQGLTLWIDSFEWLALSVLLILIFISVRAERQSYLAFMRSGGGGSPSMAFGYGWAIFGVVIAVIGIFIFITSILRFQNWQTFSPLMAGASALNGLILLPLWVLLLGFRLKRLRMSFEEELALQVDQSSDKLPPISGASANA